MPGLKQLHFCSESFSDQESSIIPLPLSLSQEISVMLKGLSADTVYDLPLNNTFPVFQL